MEDTKMYDYEYLCIVDGDIKSATVRTTNSMAAEILIKKAFPQATSLKFRMSKPVIDHVAPPLPDNIIKVDFKNKKRIV